MVQRLIVITCLGLMLAGCVTTGAAIPNTCAGWRAIHPSREDVLTRGTKEQIIAHNEYGQHRGCWK